jgi:hypothetical protein
MALFTTARITAFKPGQSPPPVRIPILLIFIFKFIHPPAKNILTTEGAENTE